MNAEADRVAIWLKRAGKRLRAVSRRRGLTLGAAVLFLFSLMIWLDIRAGKQPEQKLPDSTAIQRPARVPVERVGYSSVPALVQVTGAVEPEMQADLSSRITARVEAVLAREGDHVRAGEPLVMLDSRDLTAAVRQAAADVGAAAAGRQSAEAAWTMEQSVSPASVLQANAKLSQARAALRAAEANRDLVVAGPRRQERAQARLAVQQARSDLDLADSNLRREASLFQEGAVSAQQYDEYRNQRDVALARFQTTQQANSQAQEGSRPEDVRAAQDAVSAAVAQVSDAQAALKQAQAASGQVAVRKSEYLSAAQRVDQSRAALAAATAAQTYATIRSPFDGVVTARLLDPGSTATPGAPLLRVETPGLRLKVIVPESILSAVRPGSQVGVRLDALPRARLSGTVEEIAPAGDAASHTFAVKIALPAGSGARSGMFGRAILVTGARREILVPESSIHTQDGIRYVYAVSPDARAHLRMITVGSAEHGRLAVLSGLNPGDAVATSWAAVPADGAPVSPDWSGRS